MSHDVINICCYQVIKSKRSWNMPAVSISMEDPLFATLNDVVEEVNKSNPVGKETRSSLVSQAVYNHLKKEHPKACAKHFK